MKHDAGDSTSAELIDSGSAAKCAPKDGASETERDTKLSKTNDPVHLREGHEDDLLSDAKSEQEMNQKEELDLSAISSIKHEGTGQELKSSRSTTATAIESHAESSADLISDSQEKDEEVDKKILKEDDTKAQPTSQSVEYSPAAKADDANSVNSSPDPKSQLNLRVVTFPSNLWQDDASSVRSVTTANRDNIASPARCKFTLAEENSTFDAPQIYESLNVLENLDLYFRLFVFNYSATADSAAASSVGLGMEGVDDDDDWRLILEQHPKIQLWAIDRKMRDAIQSERPQFAASLDDFNKEEFRRVWKEKVVACGKPALKRLTPNRAARYGFHGELLWSSASTSHLAPETVAENREMIVCFSDRAIYFIVDHDIVTAKTKDRKRQFPLPIPEDATFKDAKWPHALARHSFQTLRSITIGFGFQRLTLRFSNSTFPSPEDYTYILLTSNKMEAVNLLKEIQQLTQDTKVTVGASLSEDAAIKIENDDRHVLDALGVAVAPDVIEAILHYQIVQQRWKRGERGAVRRVCVVSDKKLFLLDEDYVGDGSESIEAGTRSLGETNYRLVDSADLKQATEVKADDSDPNAILISIRPLSRFERTHNWRLVCRDRHGAERLVEDVRKAKLFCEM